MDMEKGLTAAVFGGALALFCWRFAVSRADIPAAIPLEDVPDMPPTYLAADPQDIVGLSYTAGGDPVAIPANRANIPWSRPALPVIPSAVRKS